MFLSFFTSILFIVGIPCAIIVGILLLICILYSVYLFSVTFYYKSRLGIREIKTMFVEESNELPKYSPAVVAYLVHFQKIGRREICSTLVDLIGRNLIKITLKSGFVTDNDSKYVLAKNVDEKSKRKKYEIRLMNYLFEDSDKIDSDELSKKLSKHNIDSSFLRSFLKEIQAEAMNKFFFSRTTGRLKAAAYDVVDRVVTVIATITSAIGGLMMAMLDGADGIFETEEGATLFLTIFLCLIVFSAALWGIKFLMSFLHNISCYYNELSKEGSENYFKCMAFKKYLMNCTSIPEHPIMGALIWEKYYAYSVALNCSKKFEKQMKAMNITDSTLDFSIIGVFEDLCECIGLSAKTIKAIKKDKNGGAHVDY